jgi:hypothetical protein
MWIGEMMVIRLDHLQRLLKKYSPRTTEGERVAKSTAREVVGRWYDWNGQQLVDYATLLPGEEQYVWLTQEGQRLLQLPYRKTFSGSTDRLRHYYMVNEARLALEEMYAGEPFIWLSERYLERTKEFVIGEHVADGVVVLGEERAAVEVELSLKSKERLISILRALAAMYPNVWYFTNKITDAYVRAGITWLSSEEQEVFDVINFDDMVGA